MSVRKYRHEDGVGLKHADRTTSFMTVAELVKWLNATLPPDAYEELISPGVYLEWYAPRTPEEIEQQRISDEATQRRVDEWERAAYVRLREKFKDEEV